MERIIVSRHNGAVEWLARLFCPEGLGLYWDYFGNELTLKRRSDHSILEIISVKAEVSAEDVSGKVVFGNLPLDLAVHAACVAAIVYPEGKAPRGRDLTADQMQEAGAKLAWVKVVPLPGAFGMEPPLPPAPLQQSEAPRRKKSLMEELQEE